MPTITLAVYKAKQNCSRCRKPGHKARTCLRRSIVLAVKRGLRQAGFPVRLTG